MNTRSVLLWQGHAGSPCGTIRPTQHRVLVSRRGEEHSYFVSLPNEISGLLINQRWFGVISGVKIRSAFYCCRKCSHSTRSSSVCLEQHYPIISFFFWRRTGQEEVGLLLSILTLWRVCYCSPAPSVAVDVIFSVFLDFLCICSCSFLLSFSLCFSIFSWAFRAFSRDIFISFSFFLTTARS